MVWRCAAGAVVLGGGVGLLPQVVGVGQLASLAWEGDVRPLPGEEAARNGARMPERSEILQNLKICLILPICRARLKGGPHVW